MIENIYCMYVFDGCHTIPHLIPISLLCLWVDYERQYQISSKNYEIRVCICNIKNTSLCIFFKSDVHKWERIVQGIWGKG